MKQYNPIVMEMKPLLLKDLNVDRLFVRIFNKIDTF